jgi:hypothetical protein
MLDLRSRLFSFTQAATDVKGIAEQDAVDRRRGAHLDIDILFDFRQLFQTPVRLIFFLLGHETVMLLEVLLPAQRKLFFGAQHTTAASGEHRSTTESSDSGGALQEFPSPALFGLLAVLFLWFLTDLIFSGIHVISLFAFT